MRATLSDSVMDRGQVRRLGRYELGRVLARDLEWTVFAAVLDGPGGFRKDVALEVLVDGGTLVEQAGLSGLLRHPNLAEVYAIECVDGTWVCAMERVQGGMPSGHLAGRHVIQEGADVARAATVRWLTPR
jgi:hypothetical protein